MFTIYPTGVPCQVDNIIFLYYFMREFFTIAIFKIKADIRMNKTTLNSQKEKHSMLSLRRATSCHLILWRWQFYFYPRSPCGERPPQQPTDQHAARISIHALLAESDLSVMYHNNLALSFLSTLSLRRATAVPTLQPWHAANFYPRSPCGERLLSGLANILVVATISIHALLAESDYKCSYRCTCRSYFYPRSPCGERPVLALGIPTSVSFLSTLSLRRATGGPWPHQRG